MANKSKKETTPDEAFIRELASELRAYGVGDMEISRSAAESIISRLRKKGELRFRPVARCSKCKAEIVKDVSGWMGRGLCMTKCELLRRSCLP